MKAVTGIPRPGRALAFGTASLVAAKSTVPFTILSLYRTHGSAAAIVAPLSTLSATIFFSGATVREVLPAIGTTFHQAWPLIAGSATLTLSHELFTLQNPTAWWNVETEPVGGVEMEQLRKLLHARSRTGSEYNFAVELVTAYQVHRPEEEKKRFEAFQDHLVKKGRPCEISRLFHGTSVPSAREIIKNGFRLGNAGMFGGGLYFAETPLKSILYSNERPVNNFQVMLLCDVLLGRTRELKSAKSDMDPRKDLFAEQRQVYRWGLLFYKDLVPQIHDSVMAVPSKLLPFLSVRTPEFVVYRKEQAVPRYILVVKKTRR